MISGKNEHAIFAALKQRIAEFRQSDGGSIEQFDAAEITNTDGILNAVRSLSLLDERKLVVVRNPAESKELLERIETIVEQTADSTDLLMVGKLDRRAKYYNFLKQNTELKEYAEPNAADLVRFATDYARSLGVQMPMSAASYLVELVGLNQFQIKNEVDKLALSDRVIDRDLIDELVEPNPQSKIFTMLDALFAGDGKLAWRLYQEQRAQGQEPQKIIGMLTWQLQQLTLAVFAPEKTTGTLTGAGMSPYSAQKSLKLAGAVSVSKLRYYVDQLARIDWQAKTNATVEAALAVYFTDVAVRQGEAT